MEALDRALDAQPNRPRTLAFLVLAGVWWAPSVTYVRYFAALPFDAAGRCNCSDPALLQAAGAGGAASVGMRGMRAGGGSTANPTGDPSPRMERKTAARLSPTAASSMGVALAAAAITPVASPALGV